MSILNVNDYGVDFKHVVSAPAPAGRILNYIKLAGKGELYHKNGYRSINLKNNVGSAWTTEFMIGLGLIYVETKEKRGDRRKVFLTDKGDKLNILIPKTQKKFNEGHTVNQLEELKKQMEAAHKDLFNTFYEIFTDSLPFILIKQYLNLTDFETVDRVPFMINYYDYLLKLYDVTDSPSNKNARTTTGENRVPSILQLMILFGLLDGNKFLFNREKINDLSSSSTPAEFSELELIEEAKLVDVYENDVESLVKKYGFDGNVMVTQLVRNSSLQNKFRTNLLKKYKKCLLCDISMENLLVASHIKPSVDSNVEEKADINNGFLLCSNHDKLFDSHLISFSPEDGTIILSKAISSFDLKHLNFSKDFSIPAKYFTPEVKKYLDVHHNTFKSKESLRFKSTISY